MRKSSHGRTSADLPVATPTEVVRAHEMISFAPTDAMIRARSVIWRMHREDPLINPERMTIAELERALDSPSITQWMRDPEFRHWFLQKDGWKHETEFAYQLWLDDALKRLRSRSLADKDFIAMGKLLAEVTERTSRKGNVPGQPKELSEEESRRMIEIVATQWGWKPPELESPAESAEESAK